MTKVLRDSSEVFSRPLSRIALTIFSRGTKVAEMIDEPPGMLTDNTGALGKKLVSGTSLLLSATLCRSSGLIGSVRKRKTVYVIWVLRVRFRFNTYRRKLSSCAPAYIAHLRTSY